MAISRRIARPLLASIFIAGGVDALRNPGGKVKAAEAVVGPLGERYSSLPSDPEALVRLNGAVQVGAGGLLAIGRFPRSGVHRLDLFNRSDHVCRSPLLGGDG